jgi:hypothetical protein
MDALIAIAVGLAIIIEGATAADGWRLPLLIIGALVAMAGFGELLRGGRR